MPIARAPTPPPEAIKQQTNVMDSLNAWTANDDEEDKPKKQKIPLGYTPLAQSDKQAAPSGWRLYFDSESDNFNFAIGMVIIANAIVIGLETDYGRSTFTMCEHFFNTVFVLEMFTRISQLGPAEYFCDVRYLFDCSLVVTGTLDLSILPLCTSGKKGQSAAHTFSVMRLLRILRLLRVLRVIRLFRMFGQLLLIVKAFGKALQVVLLISVIIVIMIYALGIVLTQMVGHRPEQFGDKSEEAAVWFGTIPHSMSTLFWIMFGCGWVEILDVLSHAYPTGLILTAFAGYMVITVSLMALIIGLISESLIIAQQEFKQKKLVQFASKKKGVASEYKEELDALLDDEIEQSPDGTVEAISLKQTVKGDSNLITKLSTVGVTLSHEGLASLVDSLASQHPDQRVSVDHFVEKLINLSGNSSASALVDVKYDVLKNRQKMDSIEKKLEILAKKVEESNNKK